MIFMDGLGVIVAFGGIYATAVFGWGAQQLTALGVGFVSLGEALDLTTPSGRALAGMLAVFAEFERDILRDRVKAGIAQARKEGRSHGRPQTIAKHEAEVKRLSQEGVSKREIAKRTGISRASVRHLLGDGNS